MTAAPRAVAVLAPLPLDRAYDYALPEGWPRPPDGALVEVEIGGGRAIGAVWGEGEGAAAHGKALKPLLRVLDAPPLAPPFRAFLARAADYTLTPLGAMLRLATRAPGLGEAEAPRVALVAGPAPPTA